MSKNIIFSGLASALLLACGGKPDIGTLQTVQDDIVQALPTVRHISADKLEALIDNDNDELLILDTRPRAEYNVSRIKGALQLDPDMNPEYLSANIGSAALGKTVIVYCSVGWRSSRAAKRLNQSLIASGATSVANLEGGLFGWHNESRPVVNSSGLTTLIHPYDDKWGTLLERKETIAYSPN
jgi:rhodanese-related sulfurtransferase